MFKLATNSTILYLGFNDTGDQIKQIDKVKVAQMATFASLELGIFDLRGIVASIVSYIRVANGLQSLCDLNNTARISMEPKSALQ